MSCPGNQKTEFTPIALPRKWVSLLYVLLAVAAESPKSSAASQDGFTYVDNGETISITGYTGPDGAVVIPASITSKPVTRIGDSAFANHFGLTGVTISDSVISIANNAFFNCISLAAITVEALNPAYSSLDGVLFDKNQVTLIIYPRGKNGNYIIPNSVTSIGDSAFIFCTGLTSVSIPNSVTSIGTDAFSYCAGLTTVTIPDSVTSIGDLAFYRCTGLTSVTLPNGITSIPNATFSYCASLASVAIPNSVTSIGTDAFSYCAGLTSVIIPAGVTSIGDDAFYRCTGLTGVIIPNSVTSIGGGVFYNCIGLTSVTIPSRVTGIREGLFGNCTGLKNVYFTGPVPDYVGERIFLSANNALTVFYRPGTLGWVSTFGDRPTSAWRPSYTEWAQVIGLPAKFPAAVGETDDPDHDRMTNLQEMLAYTDPADPNSVLAFEKTPRSNDLSAEDKLPIEANQFAFYFQSVPGRSYELYHAEVLGGAWTQGATITATLTQKRVVVDKPAELGFYRILVAPTE